MSHIAPYIGYVAGALSVVSYFPQVRRAWRTKETKDLSLGMLILLIVAALTWITYGIVSQDWPVIATNGGLLAMSSAILVAKLRFH
jgi:MtN3 and saliva related transmembrane protein